LVWVGASINAASSSSLPSPAVLPVAATTAFWARSKLAFASSYEAYPSVLRPGTSSVFTP
jgi:hypothetical protein